MVLGTIQAVSLLLQRKRGLVVYPSNNSVWRSFCYHGTGSSAQQGLLASRTGRHIGGRAGFRQYTVNLYSGVDLLIAAPSELSKRGTNAAHDPSSWREIGSLRWEARRKADGSIKAKPDSSGAFEILALKFKRMYGLPESLIVAFDNVHDDPEPGGTEAETRDDFFERIEEVSETGLDFFAYAGHGGQKTLPSAAVRSQDKNRLVREIRRLVKPDGVVLLYACDTGALENGFAQSLSVSLPGMTVWGHATTAHAYYNTEKIRFQNGNREHIRDLLGSEELFEKWKTHLVSHPTFYARFPFMTIEAIRRELSAS